jgi:hypothetical protein
MHSLQKVHLIHYPKNGIDIRGTRKIKIGTVHPCAGGGMEKNIPSINESQRILEAAQDRYIISKFAS